MIMDALPPVHHPHVKNITTTVPRDLVDDRYRELRRPRKVHFFCNGDRFFKGKRLHITPHRYLSFHDLLNDLSQKLPKAAHLPYGVRQIYTPVNGTRVRDVEDLQDGAHYVCAGFEGFKSVTYGKYHLERWSHDKPAQFGNSISDSRPHQHYDHFSDFNQHTAAGSYPQPRAAGSIKGVYGGFNPNRHYRHTFPRGLAQPLGPRGQPRQSQGEQGVRGKPRVITVVRFGERPRTVVKILLNRNSIRSFEQLMSDISESFGPKWKNRQLKKLFSARGKPIQSVSDFFREDDIYIAVDDGQLSAGDVQDILDELGSEKEYVRKCMREWQKIKKKNLHKQSMDDDKRDSGFADGESQGEGDTSEKDDRGSRVVRKSQDPRDGRRTRNTYNKENNNRGDGDRKRSQITDLTDSGERDQVSKSRLEYEKRKAAVEDRERARRLMQKRLEAEQRALEEEKQRRGLIPLRPYQDPYKKMIEDREKQRLRQERRARRRQENAQRHSVASDTEAEPIVSGRTSQKQEEKTDNNDDNNHNTTERKVDSALGDIEKVEQGNKETEPTEKQNSAALREKDTNTPPIVDTKNDEPKVSKKEDEVKAGIVDQPKRVAESKPTKKNAAQRRLDRQISNVNHVYDRYELGKTLGDGNFAVVKQAKLKNTNNEYAMKIVDKSKLKGKEHMIESEIAVMKMCNHPNICKLKEEFETKSEIFLVMELVKGGDLFDAITQSVKFAEKDAASMVRDLTNALFYLHSRNIVHRDMKPENLMVCRNKDNSITLKLADFGLAMEVPKPITTVCGTPTYVAPEILSEIGYGLEVDMWAIGVITYILLCGFPPFRSPDRNQTELFEYIKAGEYEFLSPYWDNVSRSAKDLIENLLVVDKKRRYSAIDTLCHPWIITQANTIQPPESMANYRVNLRHELETQSKLNLENHRKVFHGGK